MRPSCGLAVAWQRRARARTMLRNLTADLPADPPAGSRPFPFGILAMCRARPQSAVQTVGQRLCSVRRGLSVPETRPSCGLAVAWQRRVRARTMLRNLTAHLRAEPPPGRPTLPVWNPGHMPSRVVLRTHPNSVPNSQSGPEVTRNPGHPQAHAQSALQTVGQRLCRQDTDCQ
jgi:uncharacterized protein YjiS (DUF1127 family)